jgi:hypothetical protein
LSRCLSVFSRLTASTSSSSRDLLAMLAGTLRP